MAYLVSLPNHGHEGSPKFLRSDDPALIERWIKAESRPGFGVYYLPNPLKPGATTHSKENIAAIECLYTDVDFRLVEEPPEEVLRCLRNLLLRPTLLTATGHGGHPLWRLKEPIPAGTPEFEHASELQAKLIDYFCADPQVRPWSLLRQPGTLNSKEEPHVMCEVVDRGPVVDITEIEAMLEIVGDTPLLTRKPVATNGRHNGATSTLSAGHKPPINVDERLAAMRYKGVGETSVHATQLSVSASLLRHGISLMEATRTVLEATRRAVAEEPKAVNWNWRNEELAILRMGVDFIGKHPELVTALPDKWRSGFAERLARGRCPDVGLNDGGFYIRAKQGTVPEPQPVTAPPPPVREPPNKDGAPRKQRFKLVAFSDLQLGTDPIYLVDELIPIRGLVDVWGKPKCLKSFWTYDLCFHIAQGWEYRDRYVQQGAVIYCAFEGAHGYKKRKAAIKKHHNIEDEAHIPLYLISETINLISEHALLVDAIATQLGSVKPIVVVLDTLNKSLVGSENKDVDMGAYVRAAEAIRDAFDCVVIIVHHCGYDDTRPRGHSSLPAAVDAQLAVVRKENVVTVTVEMMRDGPEETTITSEVVSVDVGADRNGKVLTSLVVVPSSADPIAEGMPRGLTVFRAALISALASHGEVFHPEAGVLPIRAVNQWHVRERFYTTYAEAEEDEKKRQAKVQKAFTRALSEAQGCDMIRTLRTPDGRTMVWRPERHEG